MYGHGPDAIPTAPKVWTREPPQNNSEESLDLWFSV
jgi:hypothetical protein